MKKVSAEEIEKLFEFTKEHYVEYYDLQIELVDHLACAIEEKWEKDNTISFEKALKDVFAEFGIFGFSYLVNGRKRKLEYKYLNLIKKCYVEHLQKKEYLGLMILYMLIQFGLALFVPKNILLISTVLLYGILLAQFVRLKINYKKKQKEIGYKLILVDIIYKNYHFICFSSTIFNLLLQYYLMMNYNIVYINIILAITLPFIYLGIYIICYFLPNKTDKILDSFSPEYKLIKE
ncbi:hypothetical protein [Chishuiella sp.]|uniref:hypothetical protein n=1 Tax=Chishuiella sp. TaxID=1969467 RepID=UPI0028A59E8B|nr:hypothetical protein [Chishuiella sp.]